jgi:cobalamin biosynthesis protein CbiD
MDVAHERRSGEDRREFAIYYRYGYEHRNNTGNRRIDTVEKIRTQLTRGVLHAHHQGANSTIEVVKEIAEAFGVHPDTLEMVKHDDSLASMEICQSCEIQARINAELKTELAESRKNLEMCKSQVRDLLPSYSRSIGNKLAQ